MNTKWLIGGLGLVAVVLVGRLMPHAANLTPLYAVALFACAVFPRRWALLVPVTAMIASDLVLGLHNTVAFTWSGMLVFAALGYGLHGRHNTARIIGSALAGSAAFFVWTNFGVWLAGGLYPQTSAGLAQCYMAALPFFRNSLLGNLAFGGALFAAYDLYRLRRAARVPAT